MDIVTIVAFLTAPVFAFLNFRLVMSGHMHREHRPGAIMQAIAWVGMFFLGGVSIGFAIWQCATWFG